MWKVWSFFHKQLNYCAGVQPCLRLTPFTPDPSVLDLWKAESVESFILPISLFSWSGDACDVTMLNRRIRCLSPHGAKNWYVGTSTRSQSGWSSKANAQTSPSSWESFSMFPFLSFYSQYFQHLFQNAPSLDPFEQQLVSYDDLVQLPLQPLMDNLQNATYDVFERDHVKYQLVDLSAVPHG